MDVEALQDEKALWIDFARAPSQAGRERMIARYGDLARIHAAKLYAARQIHEIEFDEFRQYALLGLIEAVDRYDPERGALFRTYAGHRIRGAILNGIEKYNEKQQQIAARTRLRDDRVRTLFSELNASNDDPFLRLVELAIGTAIGYMLEDSSMYQLDEPSYEHNIYRNRELHDLARFLDSVVDTLPPQEQAVVRDHYYQQMRFDEIADKLALTKGRISQIHRKAMQRMRQHYDQFHLLRTDY